MPARVPPGTGLLGPVDDAAAMAANVAALWPDRARAMGAAGRALVVERFGWERTFERLFGEIYPAARAHTAVRLEEDAALWFPPWRDPASLVARRPMVRV